MQPEQIIDRISADLAAALPHSVRSFKSELEHNARAILQEAFRRFELVSRDEFDVQSKVLARTRSKLEALERQVRQLEEQLQPKS